VRLLNGAHKEGAFVPPFLRRKPEKEQNMHSDMNDKYCSFKGIVSRKFAILLLVSLES
jgi:hypothetical protein